jgi:hypothetical protein
MSAVEQECGQALSRVSLDDMLRRAANGNGTDHHKHDEEWDRETACVTLRWQEKIGGNGQWQTYWPMRFSLRAC